MRILCLIVPLMVVLFLLTGCSVSGDTDSNSGPPPASPSMVELNPKPAPQLTPEPSFEPKKDLGKYTLEELEKSIVEGTQDIEAYIEGDCTEYLRRMSEQPEEMSRHLESIELRRRVHIFGDLASYCYRPTAGYPYGDSSCEEVAFANEFISGSGSDSARMFGEFVAYYAREINAVEPPSTELYPALILETMLFPDMDIDYVSDSLLVFHGYVGLFAYDFASGEIVFSVDLQTALGLWRGELSVHYGVKIDPEGKCILLFYEDEYLNPAENCYRISTRDWSYKYENSAQALFEAGPEFFEYDWFTHGQIIIGKDGNGRELADGLYYVNADNKQWRLFPETD